MQISPMAIMGCYLISPVIQQDKRGSFVKPFIHSLYKQSGLCTDFKECYHSISKNGVIRGMHFQIPPKQHAKLVYRVSGSVTDVLLDLRKSSPPFGKHTTTVLTADGGQEIYISQCIAHGFAAHSGESIVMYSVTSQYDRNCDTGARWGSFGYDWRLVSPIISDRDKTFPNFSEFDSPFE